MTRNQNDDQYSPEDYRGFINYLLDRIDDIRVLRKILFIVNGIFCEN